MHHNNTHYTSDNNESCISATTPVPSEDLASASSKSKIHVDENYHLNVDKKLKAGSHVPCKSDHRHKSQLSQKSKKGETPPTSLDNDLDYRDTVLMGLDSMDADLNRPDNIMNPFNFSVWRSMPVEPFSIKNTDSLETVLYEMSTDIGLQNSKELSSLKTTDTYGSISMVDSTGNTPKSTSIQPVRYIFANEIY